VLTHLPEVEEVLMATTSTLTAPVAVVMVVVVLVVGRGVTEEVPTMDFQGMGRGET